ncbi:restriction endonuclease subunit S [Romboutsia sp.]|uniref:restriction endonuclease subunit S n=1 Tax=Romboutsia sp. TaxID=1965302 RepID=UPI003F4175B2
MKKTPKLRFKEFSGDWETKTLGKLGEFRKTYSFSRNIEGEGNFKHIHYGDIHMNYNGIISTKKFIPSIDIPNDENYELIKTNDIIFADASEDRKDLGKVAVVRSVEGNILSGLHTLCFRPNEELNSEFFLNHSLSRKYLEFMYTRGNGAKVLGISKSNLSEYSFLAPSEEEQEKLAKLFSLIDDKIYLQREKVEAIRDYKNGMFQKIFSQELRFKDDNDEAYPKWNNKKLIKLTEKITTKNKDFTITNVISNSSKNGLISQRDFFDKDIANQSNIDGYYVIEPGNFVYNPRKSSESPYGPINRYELQDAGVVSPLYLCFRVNNEEIDGKFLAYYFKSSAWYRFIYLNSDQGARHDRVSIKDAEFFNMDIAVPDIDEQNKIVKFLDSLECKLSKEQDKLEYLTEYKKGLLQQMFI